MVHENRAEHCVKLGWGFSPGKSAKIERDDGGAVVPLGFVDVS
jgi:hypothetical protein